MIGAVAALAVAANRKNRRHNRYHEETPTEDATPSEPSAQHEEQENREDIDAQDESPNLDDLIRLDDIDVTNSKNNKIKSVLKFRKIPWALWIVGTVVVLMSCFLFYHLTLGKRGGFIPGYREGHWWQYLIAILILLLGLAFIYAGKVETIVFDKKKKELVKRKTTVVCRSKRKRYELSEIVGVQGVKKGHDGINVNTIHYKIEIELRDKPTLKVLESIYREKVRKQVYVINKFLFGSCPAQALAIIDHSTHL